MYEVLSFFCFTYKISCNLLTDFSGLCFVILKMAISYRFLGFYCKLEYVSVLYVLMLF